MPPKRRPLPRAGAGSAPPAGSAGSAGPAKFARFAWTKLAKRLPLAFLPALAVWLALSPLYNRILTAGSENLLRVFESPDRSSFYLRDSGWMMVTRSDYGGGQGSLHEIRLADVHFNFLLWTAFAFATPAWALRARAKAWGSGLVVLALFHLALTALQAEFVYATQLGDWSTSHYGPFARNVIGLTKHVADLPLKLAMPLVLWVAFFGLRGARS
jgi:hypothetical protein